MFSKEFAPNSTGSLVFLKNNNCNEWGTIFDIIESCSVIIWQRISAETESFFEVFFSEWFEVIY